jgi:hypothetical protein
MKLKLDFITNSSSTGYTIDVKINNLSAQEFVDTFLNSKLNKAIKEYRFTNTRDEIIESLERGYGFPLKKGKQDINFGDEDGTVAGEIFDYALRSGLTGKNFSLWFRESLR